MLKILEQPNTAPYQEIFDGIRTDYPLYLTEAMDGDKVTGYIVYAYEPEQVAVHALDDGGDLMLCDGLVRSVLFKGLLRGLNKGVFRVTDASMMEKIRTLRFVKSDKIVLENIAEIMDNCKSCKESQRNT